MESWPRSVVTSTPKPKPFGRVAAWLFERETMWLAVINSTVLRPRIRRPPSVPPLHSIWANRAKSSAVEKIPEPPASIPRPGSGHVSMSGLSSTNFPSGPCLYVFARRFIFPCARSKPVSFMPKGRNIRSSRNAPKVLPETRSISAPSTSMFTP